MLALDSGHWVSASYANEVAHCWGIKEPGSVSEKSHSCWPQVTTETQTEGRPDSLRSQPTDQDSSISISRSRPRSLYNRLATTRTVSTFPQFHSFTSEYTSILLLLLAWEGIAKDKFHFQFLILGRQLVKQVEAKIQKLSQNGSKLKLCAIRKLTFSWAVRWTNWVECGRLVSRRYRVYTLWLNS